MSTPQGLKVSALLLALGGCSTSLVGCFRDTGVKSPRGKMMSPREEKVTLFLDFRVAGETGRDLRTLLYDDGRLGFPIGP